MLNEDLKTRLRDTFGLTDRQVSALESFRDGVVSKAFSDTCRNKPRDRSYFKKALSLYQNPAKYIGELFQADESKPTVSREFLEKHRKEIYNKFKL